MVRRVDWLATIMEITASKLTAPLLALALIGCETAPKGLANDRAAHAHSDSTGGGPHPSDRTAKVVVQSPILAERREAPDFVLFDQDGFPFPLAEHRGRWIVLHFFPESDTPDCACDATAFTGHLWRFNDLSAEVACITSAPRARTVLYAKKYGLQSPLLSDVDLAITGMYGATPGGVTAGEGLPMERSALEPAALTPDALTRTTVLLDPQGRVAARWDDVHSNEHIEDLLVTLRELRGAKAP